MLTSLPSQYRCNSCLIYLDAIIIFSKDSETHLQDVERILSALQAAGFSLKLRKFHLFKDSVQYLGLFD